jgi:hypothetical protein
MFHLLGYRYHIQLNLSNILLILLIAPRPFIKGGRGFDLKALGFINTTEPCFQNRDKSVLGVNF